MPTSTPEAPLPSWILEPFTRGLREPAAFSSGVELEYLIVDSVTHTMARYEGERGIGSLLHILGNEHGWTPVQENHSLVGLAHEGATISIEPGGAVEVATQPHKTIEALLAEMAELTNEVCTAAHHNSCSLLCAGYHPFETKEAVGLVPKERYHLMYPLMARTGSLGQEMMKLTASIQVTLDFSSEEDAMRKYTLGCRLVPVFIALSANSPFRHAARHEYHSFRSHIWTHTDPRRAGIPPFALTASPTFFDYASWALDTPVYFLRREGHLVPQENRTFRELLTAGEPLSLADWDLHLSTMFPWIRLRNYLEIRAFDMVPPPMQRALVALVHGLFYHPDGLSPAEQIVAHLDHQSLVRLIEEAIGHGARADSSSGSPLGSLCHRAIDVAEQGLAARHRGLLAPLRERLEHDLNQSVSMDAFVKACLL